MYVLQEVFVGANDNEKYPQMSQMDTDGGPQADFVGEQGLITDERLMIIDCLHTENAEGNGGPQADWMGERELQQIVRELKKKYIYPQMSQMVTEQLQ